MKTIAIICNIILFLFTSMVIITDGMPGENSYILLTLFLLLVPVVSAIGLVRMKGNNTRNSFSKALLVITNTALIGFTIWAIIDQYPHPRENGFIAYIVILFFTPILNIIVSLSHKNFISGIKTE